MASERCYNVTSGEMNADLGCMFITDTLELIVMIECMTADTGHIHHRVGGRIHFV